MVILIPNRELIMELNSEQTNLARTGVSIASDVATITVVGDELSPSAPTGPSATQIPQGIKVTWQNPSTNSDGSVCYDMRWTKLYYSATSPVTTSDSSYTVAARAGTSSAFSDTVAVATARYYIITALDNSGNESTASSEVNSTGGPITPTTDIPTDASGLIFDDTVGTEGVVVGDGILGIAFLNPVDTWVNFDHFRLWYAEDDGGGFGAWVEISPTNRIGYIHKGLDTTHDYRYKATVVSTDGEESTTPDKAKSDDSGYTPSGSNNDLIVAELVFAENIVAVNEVRGNNFYASSYLHIGADSWQGDGIQSEYNSGDPRFYVGNGTAVADAAARFFQFDGTNTRWKGANTELDASGNLIATSATLTGVITADTGYIGGTSGWVIAAGKLTSTDIGMATTEGDATYAFWAGNDTPASAEFSVTHAGALVAGGFTIDIDNGLYAGAGATRVQMKPGVGFWAGATAFVDAPFSVDEVGNMALGVTIFTWDVATSTAIMQGTTKTANSGERLAIFGAGTDAHNMFAYDAAGIRASINSDDIRVFGSAWDGDSGTKAAATLSVFPSTPATVAHIGNDEVIIDNDLIVGRATDPSTGDALHVTGTGLFTSTVVVGDHGESTTPSIVNVLFYTTGNIPDADTTPRGTFAVQVPAA